MSIPAAVAPVLPQRRDVAGGGLGVFLLALYIFLIYSRATEMIAIRLGNFRIALILCIILSLIALTNPRLTRMLTHRITLCFFALTAFLLLSVPTSVWRGESLRLIVLQWPLPLASFICMAVLITSLRDCMRIVTAINLGVVFIVILSLTSSAETFGRLEVSGNALTLANPNLLALQLIMGLPFCVLVIMRRGIISLAGFGALVLAGLTTYVITATGSRSGLLAMIFGAILLFILGTTALKFKLAAAGMAVTILGFFLLPGALIERYKTIFSDSPTVESDETLTAVNSAKARRRHLEQSIALTLRHPLFGVGAGQFKVAAADLSGETRDHADWLETHNTFTQVSSEAGIPAFIVFTLAIIFSGKDLLRVYRTTRKRPDLADISSLSLAVLLSLGMTFINANFASIAYQAYFPLLCGMAIAVTQTANTLLSVPLESSNTPRPF